MVTAESLAKGGNWLLAAMSGDDRRLIAGACRRVRLRHGETVDIPDEPMRHAHFPEQGMVSAVRRDGGGDRTEVCLIGAESLSGTPIVLGGTQWPYETFVQVDQLRAIQIEADALRHCMDRSATLRDLLLRAVQAQLVQVAEGLLSAAWQRLPARLARWLLMSRDRLASDRIEVTHEFLAIMIGVQRSGITAALHDLEGDRLILAERGQITIRDVAGLRRVAGSGYGVTEREQQRLLQDRSLSRRDLIPAE